MIPFLFPFSRGLLFPLVALDKIPSSAFTWFSSSFPLIQGSSSVSSEPISLALLVFRPLPMTCFNPSSPPPPLSLLLLSCHELLLCFLLFLIMFHFLQRQCGLKAKEQLKRKVICLILCFLYTFFTTVEAQQAVLSSSCVTTGLKSRVTKGEKFVLANTLSSPPLLSQLFEVK